MGALASALGLVVLGDSLASLSSYFPTELIARTAFDFASRAFELCAFAVAAVAFLRSPGPHRTQLLVTSALLFAADGIASVIQHLIRLSSEHLGIFSAWFTASEVAFALESFALVVTAGIVTAAVRSTRPRSLLRWACFALAARSVLLATAYVFELAGLYSFYGSVHPGARVTGGLLLAAAGECIAAMAAVKAARAFSAEAARRSRELATAALGFTIGFLVVAVGLMLYAVGWQDWLDAVAELALAGAAAIGAAAFLHPLEQRDGPDLPVLPNPA
jgi:uncharacterized membrane protein YidH (DUF202 family)